MGEVDYADRVRRAHPSAGWLAGAPTRGRRVGPSARATSPGNIQVSRCLHVCPSHPRRS